MFLFLCKVEEKGEMGWVVIVLYNAVAFEFADGLLAPSTSPLF